MKGFLIFSLSAFILLITILAAGFLNLQGNDTIYLALGVILTFGISIVGILIGIKDSRPKIRVVGLIGNGFILVFFFGMIIYSINMNSEEPNIPNTNNVTLSTFNKSVSKHFKNSKANTKAIISNDSVFSGDVLEVQYWLEGNNEFEEVAHELNLVYDKSFLYKISGVESRKEADSKFDTLLLKFTIGDYKFINSEYITDEIEVGIRAIFRSNTFEYDTTFFRRIEFTVKTPSNNT